jgi:GNAT superfamily N-acetyltransferase
MTLRNAAATDADRLAELSEELGYPIDSEVIRRRLERLLAKAEHIVLVAESPTNGVVGWIHAAEHDILEVGSFCEILGLVVAAGQRGKGVGRRLVEQIEDWATARKLQHVSVRSNVARPESHPFYEQIGYARVKTQHVYRKRIVE